MLSWKGVLKNAVIIVANIVFHSDQVPLPSPRKSTRGKISFMCINAQSFLFNFPLVILVAPVSVNHAALFDTTLRGYNIPTSNCDVIANLYASHLDPSVFPEPETFRPSRFINEKGEYQRHEAIIPFGLGK